MKSKVRVHWNLLNKAVKPTMHKSIDGALKGEDGTLILDDKGKAFSLNTYFITIGYKLANTFLCPTDGYDQLDLDTQIYQNSPPLLREIFNNYSTSVRWI